MPVRQPLRMTDDIYVSREQADCNLHCSFMRTYLWRYYDWRSYPLRWPLTAKLIDSWIVGRYCGARSGRR